MIFFGKYSLLNSNFSVNIVLFVLNKTYRNYSLMLEPLNDFQILNDFKNEKNILMLRMKSHQPNNDEQRLLDAADTIDGNNQFDLLSLPFDSLKQIPKIYQQQILSTFDSHFISATWKKF